MSTTMTEVLLAQSRLRLGENDYETGQRKRQWHVRLPTIKHSPSAGAKRRSHRHPSLPKTMFVAFDESFKHLIGDKEGDAKLRLLARTPCGRPLFHEAGVYLPKRNVVVCSSNRMRSETNKDEQVISIIHIPLSHIPTDGHQFSANPSDTDHMEATREAQKELLDQLVVCPSNGPHTFMPNGATRWLNNEDDIEEGEDEVVLWCEQGKHYEPSGIEAHSALVTYAVGNKQDDLPKTAVVLDSYEGRRFSSLNDVVCHTQSRSYFFTDPPYGIEQLFKRDAASLDDGETYAPNGVYMWHPMKKEVRLLDQRYEKVNGCTFVPDPDEPASTGRGLLITTDTGRFRFEKKFCAESQTHEAQFIVDPSKPACIYAYPVNYGSSPEQVPFVDVENRMLVAHSTSGAPDGIHPDELGNIWAGHGDGVHAYKLNWDLARSCAMGAAPPSPSLPIALLIGKIQLPNNHGVANFCWAGAVDEAKERFRMLLFSEDELWEAIVAVNGFD